MTGITNPAAPIDWDAVSAPRSPPRDTRADLIRLSVHEFAMDLGRLRAIVGGPLESHAGFLCSRLAERIEVVDQIMSPTAADLYRYYRLRGYDDEPSVETALAVVDERVARLRTTLGGLRWD